MALIELTETSGSKCLINTERIVFVNFDPDGDFRINLENGLWIKIKETPEQILSKMRELHGLPIGPKE